MAFLQVDQKIQFWKEFQKQFEAVGAVCRSHRAAGGQKPVKQHQQLVAVPNSLKPVATLANGGSSSKGSSICTAGRFSLSWISLRSFSESANAGFIHLWNQNHNWRLVGGLCKCAQFVDPVNRISWYGTGSDLRTSTVAKKPVLDRSSFFDQKSFQYFGHCIIF